MKNNGKHDREKFSAAAAAGAAFYLEAHGRRQAALKAAVENQADDIFRKSGRTQEDYDTDGNQVERGPTWKTEQEIISSSKMIDEGSPPPPPAGGRAESD